MKTSTGFPADIQSAEELLYVLKEYGADKNYVATHLNSEKGVIHLHNTAWYLQQAGYVDMDNEHINGDTLFRLKITMQGMEFIRTAERHEQTMRINRLTLFISIIVMIISLLSLLLVIFS